MTPEERAQAIATAANDCCYRSDGYEEAIYQLALEHILLAMRDEANLRAFEGEEA